MKIRTKMKINLAIFLVLAVWMGADEATMRLLDDLRMLLDIPIAV